MNVNANVNADVNVIANSERERGCRSRLPYKTIAKGESLGMRLDFHHIIILFLHLLYYTGTSNFDNLEL